MLAHDEEEKSLSVSGQPDTRRRLVAGLALLALVGAAVAGVVALSQGLVGRWIVADVALVAAVVGGWYVISSRGAGGRWSTGHSGSGGGDRAGRDLVPERLGA